MDQENTKVAPKKYEDYALQRPLMLIAISIMFSGILIAGTIVATRTFPTPSTQNTSGTAQKDDTQGTVPAAVKDDVSTVSLGDDPVLGDKAKAKVAIVEFSDYECPFCQKFHAETSDALVKEYVDTGKAIVSFKDFPLSFHEPMASKEAAAANCVQKLSGDKAYFTYNSLLYKNTAANGKGMPDAKMADLAVTAGVARDAFAECVAKNDFKDEIANDQADGDKAGVTGTPAFIIGTFNTDGTLTNTQKLVGAQPLSAFEKVIDAQLKK
jgi:protein-disulfide isomerase